MTSSVISVARLVQVVQDLVEDNFTRVLVRGEISNVSRPASGHHYFSLKDDRAQLRCVQFRSAARLLRFDLEDGLEVICQGTLSVYGQRGDLQLIVERIDPVGQGSLQLAFQQLRARLEAEGLFASERKRSLPLFPATVGVVTSATGAAVQDILNVLRRRSCGLQVLLRPVAVQGDEAPQQIVDAIADLNREGSCDVLIVGRGGGSAEDLSAFNDERVARAIVASQRPVVSAVGHEVDVTIADLVADLRAPTPSAAAELVVRNRQDVAQHLDHLAARLDQVMLSIVDRLRMMLDQLERRLRSPRELLTRRMEVLSGTAVRLERAIHMQMERRNSRFGVLTARLEALSPLKVLARGYAVVHRRDDGRLLTDASQVVSGDRLDIDLARGTVSACVVDNDGSQPS